MPLIRWNGSTADWTITAAWDLGLPGVGDDVLFNTGSTYTVTVSTAVDLALSPLRTMARRWSRTAAPRWR